MNAPSTAATGRPVWQSSPWERYRNGGAWKSEVPNIAETDAHEIPRMYAVTGLRDFLRYHRDVYVSGNVLIYYEEGNVDAAVAPDVFVVFGVPNRPRPIYKLWEEGKSPIPLRVGDYLAPRRDPGDGT